MPPERDPIDFTTPDGPRRAVDSTHVDTIEEMASPFGTLVLLVDRRAGRGRVMAEMPEVERALLAKGLEYRVEEPAGSGDLARRARAALEAGERFVVAVGDDRTVADVVNGMIESDRPVAQEAVLGVVAAGSGCDFVRTFGLPGDATRAATLLAGDKLVPFDVAKVEYAGSGGERAVRYFPGVGQAGMGAAMVARAGRLPRPLGRARYFVGFWSTLARYRAAELHVRAGSKQFEGKALTAVVANCQYHGEGRRVSPRSWPGDGLLDVLVMTGPKSDAFTRLPAMYQGDYLPDPNVVELKGRTIQVDADRPVPVEADGTVLGTTPATFDVIRLALRLKI
jgi:diacylglycerol kinase (ATP)